MVHAEVSVGDRYWPVQIPWAVSDIYTMHSALNFPGESLEEGGTSYLGSSIYTDTGFPWQRDNNKRLMAGARLKV